jgi:hypothetical protein
MGLLEQYQVTNKPPKVTKAREKRDVMEKVNRNFLAGLEKQIAQAKAYKPGAKDAKSWVTRDADADKAWITLRYGARPMVIKGTTKTTLGPVEMGDVVKVLQDVKKAHASGELQTALQKASVLGPRKKKK